MVNIDDKIIKELVKGYKSQEEVFGKDGLIKGLVKKITEQLLEEELTEHLGYEKNSVDGYNSGNSRNGKSQKVLKGEYGEIPLEIPRDRDSSFNPVLIPKHKTKLSGFEDKIISLYARGMSTRDIQEQLKDLYGADFSNEFISKATESVLEEAISWQNRPLEKKYAIVYLDALFVKVQEQKQVVNKPVYIALGLNMEGKKELLGIWIHEVESAKSWLSALSELKSRGVQEIIVACCDGLIGFAEAINSIFPKTQVQGCIVHKVRNSLKYVPYKEKKMVAHDLKEIYTAPSAEAAAQALDEFSAKWDSKYPAISRQWRNTWDTVIVMFNYPPEIRKIIYTTNSIESLNSQIRKIIKNKRVFPNNNSLFKLIYLAIRNLQVKWTMPIHNWAYALNAFEILDPTE